jgi:hypothetical protein
MAETATFCLSGAIAIKAGANVDTGGYTEANRNIAAYQAEGLINVLTRHNWTDAYSGLNQDVKAILEEAAACWAAIDFISYDMSGYTSRTEAELMINVNWAKFWKLIEILKDQKAVTYTVGA